MELSVLLGVEEDTEKHLNAKNNNNNGNSTSDNMNSDKSNKIINLQMINILQSQRDSYKDKLTKVTTEIIFH